MRHSRLKAGWWMTSQPRSSRMAATFAPRVARPEVVRERKTRGSRRAEAALMSGMLTSDPVGGKGE